MWQQAFRRMADKSDESLPMTMTTIVSKLELLCLTTESHLGRR